VEAAQRIQLPVLEDGSSAPRPTHCVANAGLNPSQSRIFLAVPPYYPDEVVARQWAQRNGYQMAPSVGCPPELLGQARGEDGASSNANDGGSALIIAGSYHIASPRAGETVSGQVPIVGTANFDPTTVQ